MGDSEKTGLCRKDGFVCVHVCTCAHARVFACAIGMLQMRLQDTCDGTELEMDSPDIRTFELSIPLFLTNSLVTSSKPRSFSVLQFPGL